MLQSCPTLCDPMDCSLPGSSVHGILQARILEWVAISSYRGSSRSRDRTRVSYVSCIGSRFFTTSGTWEAHIVYVLHSILQKWDKNRSYSRWTNVHACSVVQLGPTLCYPMDHSPTGSSVHEISQARTLEWVDIPFSRGSSWLMD